MGVALRHVGIVDVRVGDHRLVDLIEVDDDFGIIFGVGVGRQSGLLARADLGDALVGEGDQALERAGGIFHALVDHDLDARLGDFQRLDQRFVLRDTDRRLRLHLGGPVGEGEGLVGQQRADMDFDDAALEHILASELVEHLRLGGVDDVAEVHIGRHLALEGDLDRLRDRHGGFTGGQRQRNRARVRAEGHALRHAGVAVAADDDRPVVHGDVVQHLMDDVGHRVIDALGVARGDQAEIVHEAHELGNVGLGLLVPHRRGVAARLIGAIDQRRDDGGGHRLQFLRGHQAGGVLRPDDVDLHAHVRTGMQHLARRHAHGVAVEDLLYGGQALVVDRDFLVRREHLGCFDAQRFGGEGLELLAEDDGVAAARLHEFHLLGREGGGDVDQFLAGLVGQLLVLDVDLQHRAGRDREGLLQHRIAVIVDDRLALAVGLLDPVLEVEADAAGDVHGGREDRRDAVGAGDDRCIVDEGDIGALLLAGPQRHIVDARHARGADAHRALFGDQHDARVGMLGLQGNDFLLRFGRDHAQAVQFAVRARVRLVARREKVGRDIAFAGDEGHDLDLVLDLGKLGEEFGLGIAFQHVLGDGIAGREGIAQAEHVGVVEEDLGFQDVTRLNRQRRVIAERDVEQHGDRGAALHMAEQFQREGRGDFRDGDVAQHDLLEEVGLHARSAGGAGQGVVDEEFEGVGAMFAARVLDQGDEFGDEGAVVDRLGCEPLDFPAVDFGQIIQVDAHYKSNAIKCMNPGVAPPDGFMDRPGAVTGRA